MSNNQSCSERVDDMFVVWVENESVIHLTCKGEIKKLRNKGREPLTLKSNYGLKFKFLFHDSLFVCSFECVRGSINNKFIFKLTEP